MKTALTRLAKLLLLVGLAHLPAQAASVLSGQDVYRFVIGNSRVGSLDDGTAYCEHYASNGQIRGRDVEFYTGSWAIDGDLLCYDYAGSEFDNCERLAVSGDTIQAFDPRGTFTGFSQLKLGNACGV